ncbi:MAG TPA: hypothetical protein VF746_17475 [Longimicrobium sp.]|jgi:hypothetical protein
MQKPRQHSIFYVDAAAFCDRVHVTPERVHVAGAARVRRSVAVRV